MIKGEDDLDDDETTATASPSASLFQLDEKAITTLDSVVMEIETWLKERIAAQEKLNLWEEPVLLLTELERKGNQIQSALRKIFLDQTKTKSKTKSSTSTVASTATAKPGETENASGGDSWEPMSSGVEDDFEGTRTTTATVTSTIIEEAASKGDRKHEEL